MALRINPTVLWQRLSDGAVLLDPTTEVYFGLNDVGAKVWELMSQELYGLDELCSALVKDYPDAEPAVVRSDVTELLQQLEISGLLVKAEIGRSHASAGDRA